MGPFGGNGWPAGYMRPNFGRSPETVLKAIEELRECGVGVADMVFTIGGYAQKVQAMKLFSRHVLPMVQAWDDTAFICALP